MTECKETNDDWEDLARTLLASELFTAANDVDLAFDEVERALRQGEDLDADDVREARFALREAWRLLEDKVAPFTDGVEPWARPPDVPTSVARKWAVEDYNLLEPEADR